MRLYNKVRIPVYPIYGGFPVKFRTYLGKPIPYDESLTPQDLQIKVVNWYFDLLFYKLIVLPLIGGHRHRGSDQSAPAFAWQHFAGPPRSPAFLQETL